MAALPLLLPESAVGVPVPQGSDIKSEKTESIRHYYSVRYPSDRVLAPTETGGS